MNNQYNYHTGSPIPGRPLPNQMDNNYVPQNLPISPTQSKDSGSQPIAHAKVYPPPPPPSPSSTISALRLSLPSSVSSGSTKDALLSYAPESSTFKSQPHGHRSEPTICRGVITYAAREADNYWRHCVPKIINYQFSNLDLLEEALESPDSGVTCVGDSHRHLGREGNRGLASVGFNVMELILNDEAYSGKMSEGEAISCIKKVLSRHNLNEVGCKSKIERFVRRRKSGVKKTSIFKMLKEDATFEDPTRTVARAVKAVIGAVYYDGGLESARSVMHILGLRLKI